MNTLDDIKKILESDAGFLIEEQSNNRIDKRVVDNRFSLIKQKVNLVENKDDNYYTELVKLFAFYIDQLYDKKVEDFPSVVYDENGEIISQDYDVLSDIDILILVNSNHNLSRELFDYVCDILESNKDTKLDIETLKRLLNRNPKLFDLSVEESFLYRFFNYSKLVEIINENHIMDKLNISIDEMYQLLLDTFQINNDIVFGGLVKPEQFRQNHQKIDEILMWCNAISFVDITNIIKLNFDKDYDGFSLVKKRIDKNGNSDNFCEDLIIQLLKYSFVNDYKLIHQILTDAEIQIDYDSYYADNIGQTNLKSMIALRGNKTIIKDLLSKEENIQKYYFYDEASIQLFRLYGIIGDYEKALTTFNEMYNYGYDYTDNFDDDFNRVGYTYGGWQYEDTIAAFLKDICKSLNSDNIDYSRKKEIINQIVNNNKVKYINLEETIDILQEELSEEDFKSLLDTLLTKRNNGDLAFITANEDDDLFLYRYIIKVASEEEVQNYLSSLNKEEKTKVLSLNLKNDN